MRVRVMKTICFYCSNVLYTLKQKSSDVQTNVKVAVIFSDSKTLHLDFKLNVINETTDIIAQQ